MSKRIACDLEDDLFIAVKIHVVKSNTNLKEYIKSLIICDLEKQNKKALVPNPTKD